MKPNIQISLVLNDSSFLRVVAYILNEIKSHLSSLIVVDAIPVSLSRLRFTQFIDNKLVILLCLCYALVHLDLLVPVVMARAHLW